MKDLMKYVCAAFLMLLSGGLSLDAQSQLENFFSHFDSSCISFQCEYRLIPSADSGMSRVGAVTGNAAICMQGEAYVFEGDGLVIKSDTKDICVADENAREVVLESVPSDLSEVDLLQNPAFLICGLRDNFKVVKSSLNDYVLVPVVKCGIKDCRLIFSASNPGPSSAFFNLSDGGVLEVKMSGYEFSSRKPMTFFSPDSLPLDSSWIVTDLR